MKIFIAVFGMFLGSLAVNAQGLNYLGKKVEFSFPTEITESKKVTFPTYETVTPDYDDTLEVAVTSFYTYVKPDTLTGNTLLMLDISDYVTAGAMLWLEVRSDTTGRNVTFNTSTLTAPTLSGTASKTKVQAYVYNGTKFVAASALIQLD